MADVAAVVAKLGADADAAADQVGGDGGDPRVEFAVSDAAGFEDEQLPVRGARRLIVEQVANSFVRIHVFVPRSDSRYAPP